MFAIEKIRAPQVKLFLTNGAGFSFAKTGKVWHCSGLT
jgi:hypothetical protein